MLPVLLPGHAEHALLGLRRGAREEHLRGVDVALGDRSLRVPCLEPDVRLRVARGGLVGDGGVAEVVQGRNGFAIPAAFSAGRM